MWSLHCRSVSQSITHNFPALAATTREPVFVWSLDWLLWTVECVQFSKGSHSYQQLLWWCGGCGNISQYQHSLLSVNLFVFFRNTENVKIFCFFQPNLGLLIGQRGETQHRGWDIHSQHDLIFKSIKLTWTSQRSHRHHLTLHTEAKVNRSTKEKILQHLVIKRAVRISDTSDTEKTCGRH